MFVGMGGRLLPTWMFFNSMQLIAHTPLLDTYMPSNLNYFLIKFLDLVRINAKDIDESIEKANPDEGLNRYHMVQRSDSFFSSLLNDCGYRTEFSRNLMLVLALTTALIVVLVALLIWDCLSIRSSNLAKGIKKRGKGRGYRRSAYMANFTLRFFYEFFFEICLSIMIHITALNDGSSLWLYSLSMLLALAILAFIVSLILLFFRYGPYSEPKSYARNSLRESWWGARHLDPNQIESVEATSPPSYDG